MIDIDKFQSRVEVVEDLMQAKLGGRSKALSAQFRRAGRSLPKRIRTAGRLITDAQTAFEHPKLARLHDPSALNTAFADVTDHLASIDPSERRKGIVLSVLGGIVFNLILLGTALIVFLRWQGMI